MQPLSLYVNNCSVKRFFTFSAGGDAVAAQEALLVLHITSGNFLFTSVALEARGVEALSFAQLSPKSKV